jgi:hypothetical protein
MERELYFIILTPLQTALLPDAHIAQRQFLFERTDNERKEVSDIRGITWRLTVFKSEKQNLEPKETLLRNNIWGRYFLLLKIQFSSLKSI